MDENDNSTQRVIFDLVKALAGQANILTCPRIFITWIGDIEGAVFFSQCLYWSDKGDNTTPDGWFYKTVEDWFKETGLSYYKVSKYAAICESLGLLRTKVRKVGNAPTLHFFVNQQALTQLVIEFFQGGNSASTVTGEDAQQLRKQRRKKEAENSKAALAPRTEGGYILFNRLADEFRARGRRAPKSFGSLTQQQRFEAAESRLEDNFEAALNDALSIPLLSLAKITNYMEKWGTGARAKKLELEKQAAAIPQAAAPAPALAAGQYDADLESRRTAAALLVQQAREKAAA